VPAHLILNTGPFAALDQELTLQVLQRLPLRDKLAACTAVCAGWRALRNTTASPLFTDLNLLLDVYRFTSAVRLGLVRKQYIYRLFASLTNRHYSKHYFS